METFFNDNNGHIASPQDDSSDHNDNSNSNSNSNSKKRKMYQEEQRDDDDNEENNNNNNNSNNNCSRTPSPSQCPSSTVYSTSTLIDEENDHREDVPARQEVVDIDEEIMMINSHSYFPYSDTSFPSTSFVSPIKKKRKLSLSALSPLSSRSSSSSFSLLSPPPLAPRKSLS